jgi:sulfide:quinone oxidoreductase
MCFIETGEGRATMMSFDYDKPGRPSQPNRIYHWVKAVLNRLYWIAIPSGRV